MKKFCAITILPLLIFAGCSDLHISNSSAVDSAGADNATPPVAAAVATEQSAQVVAVYKSDLPPSHVIRKNAELWEYVKPGFYVPLATMRDSDKAWSLQRDASGTKLPGTVQQLILGGGSYYRAMLGPFKSKKEAQKQAKEFEKKKLVDTKVVVEYLNG